MAIKTTHLVPSVVIKRKKLVSGYREKAPTESGAMKRAEAMAKRIPGTAAIRVMPYEEPRELENAVILDHFRQKPDDLPDNLLDKYYICEQMNARCDSKIILYYIFANNR